MKKHFTLTSYATFTAALLAGSKADAQMTTIDYEPDIRMLNWGEFDPADDSLAIDIDGNGEYDLLFTVLDGYWTDKLYMEPNDMVSALYAGVGFGYDYARGVVQGNTIDPDMEDWKWSPEKEEIRGVSIYSFAGTGGVGCTEYYEGYPVPFEYFGLKFNIDGATHYGWVRLCSRTTNLHNDGFACENEVGAVLTVFEIAYNETPDVPVVADNNKIEDDIISTFFQGNDGDDFTDLIVDVTNNDIDYDTDCAALRIYLINNKADALNFTTQDALNVLPENYITYEIPDFFYESTIMLTPSTKDIFGNSFEPDSAYTIFTMKVNDVIDTAAVSISAPSPVIKALPKPCNMGVYLYLPEIVDHTGTAADITVTFDADPDEYDISAYRIGLGTLIGTLDACDMYSASSFDDGEYIEVPKSGADTYSTNLAGLLYDLHGDPLVPGGEYSVIVSAAGDGYFADLPCIDCGYKMVQIPTQVDNYAHPEIQMYSAQNILYIHHPENNSGYSAEIMNTVGAVVYQASADDIDNAIDLNDLPAGIYVATLREEGNIVHVLKFRIDQ